MDHTLEDEQRIRAGRLGIRRNPGSFRARLGIDANGEVAVGGNGRTHACDDALHLFAGKQVVLAGMTVDQQAGDARHGGDGGDVARKCILVDRIVGPHRADGRCVDTVKTSVLDHDSGLRK